MSQQRYRLIKRLDAGGMAEVFKGVATSLKGFDKIVAIKRVLPHLTRNEKFVRMFLDEARLSLKLNHANIVQVFDLGQADGTYFIVMEFIDGINLKHLIDAADADWIRFPIEDAVFIAMEVVKGLAYAHRLTDGRGHPLNIVHRDISPPNILISQEGEIKIADFGLAKAKSQLEHTDPGFIKGKFGYLSPEAANGDSIDARTDIFALGIVLWEMLTHRRLFLGETDLQTLDLIRDAKIPSVRALNPKVPPKLESILFKALAKDVHARYQRIEDMGQDLSRFLFEYGRKVNNFEIAQLVKTIREEEAFAASIEDPLDIMSEEMILEEITQWTEELPPIDLPQAHKTSENLEDPSQWFEDEEEEETSGEEKVLNLYAIGVGDSGVAAIDLDQLEALNVENNSETDREKDHTLDSVEIDVLFDESIELKTEDLAVIDENMLIPIGEDKVDRVDRVDESPQTFITQVEEVEEVKNNLNLSKEDEQYETGSSLSIEDQTEMPIEEHTSIYTKLAIAIGILVVLLLMALLLVKN